MCLSDVRRDLITATFHRHQLPAITVQMLRRTGQKSVDTVVRLERSMAEGER